MHPTTGDDNDKSNKEKRSTHDPRLNVKKNQDVNVHCNENKTLKYVWETSFLLVLYFSLFRRLHFLCVFCYRLIIHIRTL